MSIEALAYMNNMMTSLGIPYEFMRWNSGLPHDYYFVGEYIETDSPYRYENGHTESTFILRGFTRGDWLLLEEAKAKALEKDKKRSEYYNYYTFGEWGMAGTYDLCIDSSILGIEGTADFIIDFARKAGKL